jgi:hypothetical protein
MDACGDGDKGEGILIYTFSPACSKLSFRENREIKGGIIWDLL